MSVSETPDDPVRAHFVEGEPLGICHNDNCEAYIVYRYDGFEFCRHTDQGKDQCVKVDEMVVDEGAAEPPELGCADAAVLSGIVATMAALLLALR